MRSIADWLASIGLGEYAERFAENAIDLSVVTDLTEQDLKDLDLLLGHRRKMLRAIAELNAPAFARAEKATELMLGDESERRHLTVMFCDLVGSTALSTWSRPRRHVAGDRVVSQLYRRGHRPLPRSDRPIHGRWRARLFWISRRARG